MLGFAIYATWLSEFDNFDLCLSSVCMLRNLGFNKGVIGIFPMLNVALFEPIVTVLRSGPFRKLSLLVSCMIEHCLANKTKRPVLQKSLLRFRCRHWNLHLGNWEEFFLVSVCLQSIDILIRLAIEFFIFRYVRHEYDYVLDGTVKVYSFLCVL